MTKSFVFEAIQSIHSKYISIFFRNFGQSLYKKGLKLSRGQIAIDRIQPSHTKVELNKKSPKFSKYTFIAPNNTIIGNTTIGDNTSIYYTNTIKSGFKNSQIKIGESTTIQDLNIIKSTNENNTNIGNRVYIGSNCILKNCTIEDEAIIGNGAKVMQNAIVRKRGFLGAGAVLGEGQIVGENEVWVGSPAKFLKIGDDEQNDFREELLDQFDKLSFILAGQYRKDGDRLLLDEECLGNSSEFMGADVDYVDDNCSRELSAQEQLIQPNFKFEANLYLNQKHYQENRNKIKNDNEYDMQNFPENLNIHKKNYRFDEKFEKELLNDPTSKKTFYDKEQENSIDPGFTRKF